MTIPSAPERGGADPKNKATRSAKKMREKDTTMTMFTTKTTMADEEFWALEALLAATPITLEESQAWANAVAEAEKEMEREVAERYALRASCQRHGRYTRRGWTLEYHYSLECTCDMGDSF